MVYLVAPGVALIALTYGLARFAYGLFLPEMREAFGLSSSVLGVIGAGSYAGYCVAVVVSLVYTARTGPRFMAVAAGVVAVVGMAAVAVAPAAWTLALGVLVAGSSTGLASPPMAEAVSRAIRKDLQDRANTLINCGTGVGVALSGPAALVLAGQWRVAWAVFAAVGIAVLLWNAAVALPFVTALEVAGDAGHEMLCLVAFETFDAVHELRGGFGAQGDHRAAVVGDLDLSAFARPVRKGRSVYAGAPLAQPSCSRCRSRKAAIFG